MAHYDVFREQLAIKYPAFGHALWEPNPRNPDMPVQVGDVGFIRSGKFHRLFNALLSAEDQPNVPEHYEQLTPRFSDHINKGTLSSNHYCSDGIDVELEPNFLASGPDDFERITFSNSRRRGAVLSLPVDARCEDTLAKGDFSSWMVKQIDHWFAFAQGLGLGIERIEEIILVTGCHHTRSWTNIAFFGSQHNAHAAFGVKAVHSPAISVSWQPSPERVRGAVLHRGPSGTNLPEDQCVFIRGFRVARTFWILPRHLKAAAGPSPDIDGHDFEPDIEVVSISAVPTYQDPLHLLQDYVAEKAPDCDMVLIHDDDLATVPLETHEPDMMMDLLRGSNIEVHEVSCDLSATSTAPKTEGSLIKVAMLSTTFQNWNMGDTVSPSQSSLPSTQNIDLGQEQDDLMPAEPFFPTQELPVNEEIDLEAEDDGTDESSLEEIADYAMPMDDASSALVRTDGASSTSHPSRRRGSSKSKSIAPPVLLHTQMHIDNPPTPPLSSAQGQRDEDLELEPESLGSEDHEIPPDRLVKLEKIGSDGFKDVFIGKFKRRKVAIAEFRGHLTAEDIMELKLLGGFNHPNIVRFLGVSIPEDTSLNPVMTVSELCANGDLFEYIRNVPPPTLDRALSIMLDVARGLEYLHERKPSVIHRDCKSSNVLITSKGTAKITDFGLDQVKQSTWTMVRGPVGTVNWQAPELWHAHPKYNPKVDVFACGVVYWEMLQWHLPHKKYPWEGMNEHEIHEAVGPKHQRPSVSGLRKQWCPEIVDLIERMWAQEHQDRPTITEVVTGLEELVRE